MFNWHQVAPMAASRTRYDPGSLVVTGLGCALVALHLSHALSADESSAAFATGILTPLVLSLFVTNRGYRLWRSSLGSGRSLRVAGWTVAGAASLVGGTTLLIAYQTTHGVRVSEPAYLLAGAASFGAPAGILLGNYDVRLRQERGRAQDALDAVTVFNRLLRHDLRNKMNVVRGRTTLLARNTTDDAADHATVVREAVDDIIAISEQSQQLEGFISAESNARQTVDLSVAVERAVADVRDRHPDIRVDGLAVETCPVIAHPKFELALVELLENAVVHGETRTPRVTARESADGGRVELRVADDGPGIPETVVDTLERGYETSLSHNLGLGLWLVSWVVDASDGTIEFSQTTDGTAVTLSLECARESGEQIAVGLPSSFRAVSATSSSADD